MYRKIVMAVAPDREVDVLDLIDRGRSLLSEGGEITLLSVVEHVPSYVVEFVARKPESKIRKELSAWLEAMAEGKPDVSCAVVSGYPGTAIPDFAEKCGAELIVISSHRPGLQEWLLGSTASRVVQCAQCSVLVLR